MIFKFSSFAFHFVFQLLLFFSFVFITFEPSTLIIHFLPFVTSSSDDVKCYRHFELLTFLLCYLFLFSFFHWSVWQCPVLYLFFILSNVNQQISIFVDTLAYKYELLMIFELWITLRIQNWNNDLTT